MAKKKYNDEVNYVGLAVEILVYAFVLTWATSIFNNFYIANFVFAVIAAIILSLLNYTIKPILVVLTLPLSIVTLGILYPITNMIILKLCDWLMGNAFEISGFFSMFFISIFIGFFKIILDSFITNHFRR